MNKAKKQFGQHFLSDSRILSDIVDSAKLNDGDRVWEIGPGYGALTDHLLSKDIKLSIFEIDEELIPHLNKKYSNRCEIIFTDILKIDWVKYLYENPEIKCNIVSNLPYQISSPFLYKLTEFYNYFDTVVIMLQKEVAKRLCAAPSTKDYGVLTLKTNFYFTSEYLFEVSRDKFHPAPKVDSAVIKLSPRKDIPKLKNLNLFWEIVECAFRNRRKTLKNNLMKLGYFMQGNTVQKQSTLGVQCNTLQKQSALGVQGDTLQKLDVINWDSFPIDLSKRGEALSEKDFISLYEYILQCFGSK